MRASPSCHSRQRVRGYTHSSRVALVASQMEGENLHLLSKHLPEMRARLDSILANAPRGQPPATAEPPSSVLGWLKRADAPTKRALTLMSVVALLLCGVLYAMTLTAAPAHAPVVDRPATIIQALLYEAREQVRPGHTAQRVRSVAPESFPLDWLRCTSGRRCRGCPGRQNPRGVHRPVPSLSRPPCEGRCSLWTWAWAAASCPTCDPPTLKYFTEVGRPVAVAF